MTLFQLILIGATAYFVYQIYRHVSALTDEGPKLPSEPAKSAEPVPETPQAHIPGTSISELIAKADRAFEAENLSDARVYLERAEKEDHENVEVLNKLGYVLYRLGAYEDALHYYRRALDLDPNDDLTHNAIAAVLRKLGRLDEAQEHYKAAADIDDSFELTYYNYGQLLLEKGDMEGARMMFEKALELKPDYTEAQEALANLDQDKTGGTNT